MTTVEQFTIHFATINTERKYEKVLKKANLQYTLLLLIPINLFLNIFFIGIYNTLCYY